MPKHLSGPRHLAHPKPSRRVALTVGGMLASSSAIAGASIVAVIAAGGTYAMWNDSASLDGGTIHSGSLNLTVNDVESYVVSGADWSKLLPGDVVSQEVTVKNTGTVPGTVSAQTSGSFDPLLVHVKKGSCSGTIGGMSSTVSPTDLGVFAAGEASVVCLQVTMPADAANTAQGTSQTFTVTFTSTTGS
jgi:alternate signal-mediated exported protein